MIENTVVPPSDAEAGRGITIPEHATPQDLLEAIAARIRELGSTDRLTQAAADCTVDDERVLRATLDLLLKMNPNVPTVDSAPSLTDVQSEAESQAVETPEQALDPGHQVEAQEGEITPQKQLAHVISLIEAIVATPDLLPERKTPLMQAIQDISKLEPTIRSTFLDDARLAREHRVTIPEAQTIAQGYVTRSEIKRVSSRALCIFDTLFENGQFKENEDTKHPDPNDLVTLGKGLGVELGKIGEHAEKGNVFVLCDEAPGPETQYYMLGHEQQAPVEGGDPTKREVFHLRVRDDMLSGWEITYYFSKKNGASTKNIVRLVPPADFLSSLIQSVIEEQMREV